LNLLLVYDNAFNYLKNDKMFAEYIILFKYLLLSLIASFLLFFISFILVYQNMDSEKISVYECGFSPFSDMRGKFEIRFYIIAILFLVFDLEIVFLIPWLLIILQSEFLGFFSMYGFLVILTLGFFFELYKGALK
jgi:NADH-quinone oxidoreductase subunit A